MINDNRTYNDNYLQQFFFVLAVVMFVVGLIVNYGQAYVPSAFVQLFRYGRANMSKVKPVLLKNIEVPKSWFIHFYACAVIFQLVVVYTVLNTYLYIDGDEKQGTLEQNKWLVELIDSLCGVQRPTLVNATTTLVAIILFLLHLSRRLYECVFVSVYSDTKMNILHYLVAFAHYFGSIICMIVNSPEFSNSSFTHEEFRISFKVITPTQVLAIALFLFGSIEQNKAHRGFADLRKGKDKKVVTHEHRIPSGGLFDLISCPNYFAEIIIYTSFAVLFGLQNRSWNTVLLWVASNQVTSGVMNHKWYLGKFPNYPKDRKAIIPYIY